MESTDKPYPPELMNSDFQSKKQFESHRASEITIQQGSQAWLDWRKEGLGASEIPAVMNESEYETPLSLWRLKTGRTKPESSNYAQTIGLDNEAKARSIYELDTGIDCPPALFQHPDLVWARCSLDGWVEELKRVVEIKCMGREKHALTRAGQVPATYIGQLQWQLFVTGAKVAHFVSLNPETMADIEIVAVTPDMAYWVRMIPAAEAFWKCIETDTPPAITDRDFLHVEDEKTVAAFTRWRRAKEAADQLEGLLEKLKVRSKQEAEKLEAARAEIKELMVHPKIKAAGVKVIKVRRKSGETLDIRLDEGSQT